MTKIEDSFINQLVQSLLVNDKSLSGLGSNFRVIDIEQLSQLRASFSIIQQYIDEISFKTNDYADSGIERHILTQTDKENDCYSLILGRPTTIVSRGRINDLQGVSIYDAKRLLQTTVVNKWKNTLENGLTATIYRYGNKDAVMFRDAINLYEEQVIRQSYEAANLEQNLFALNREAKYQIVSDNYDLFIDFFLDNATECIWGSCTPSAKKLLDYSKKNSTYQHLRVRENFIRIISDYTTLGELENEPIQTLNRFLVKQ